MPKNSSKSQKFDWILNNPKIKSTTAHSLKNNSEIPQMVFGYSPVAAEEASNFIMTKMLPSDANNILHKEKGLLTREVGFIRQRLDRVGKINLFDVSETTGDSSLPFIFELLEYEMLGKYIPVTPNAKVNEAAIKRLRSFAIQALLPDFGFDSILADAEVSEFKAHVIDVCQSMKGAEFTNLFLLTGSRLGNSHDPQKMLHNIYQSMNEGDYLAVIQGLYRPGVEDMVVADYSNIASDEGNLMVQKMIASELNPDGDFEVYWDDSENPGVRFGTKVKQVMQEFGVEVEKESKVTLFRSTRFKEFSLRNMIQKVGFSIVDIAYDKYMDHGLFFLEK